MKLLIVDDQASVVQGLLQGANWAALGFDCVETAFNAVDARASLRRREAEVMLCDIEMPVESGLDLLSWIRSEKMKTRCVFLTAHARFDYAREAVRLGGFDYIVQPAPYAQIVQVVEKAVQEVKLQRVSEELQKRGEIFNERQDVLVANLLRDYLAGTAAENNLKSFEEMGLIPLRSQPIWLILLQPLHWLGGEAAWDWPLLGTAIGNMCSEVFAPLEMLSVTAPLAQEQCLLLMLQSKVGEDLGINYITRQLVYLQSAGEQYIHFTSAFYLIGPCPFAQAPEKWRQLLEQRGENVALKCGVFAVQAEPEVEHKPFHIPQIVRWGQLMQQGYALAMEQEAFQLLDKMAANNQLDSVNLRFFYQDFMQMVFSRLEHSQSLLHDMFQEPEALELYRNGMKTVDDMKALIHYVALSQTQMSAADEHNFVEVICKYISEHLENELHRDQLAEVVHLNSDYLNRLFKKETGLTLKEYVVQQKMQEARSLLRTTSLPISFIAAKVGYSNFSHFSNSYKKMYDRSPQEDRQNTV